MDRKKRAINPFYPILLVFAVAFLFTAFAFCVMAFRAANPRTEPGQEPSGIMVFMRHHGTKLLMSELILLGIATYATIGTDKYWNRRDDFRTRGGQSDKRDDETTRQNDQPSAHDATQDDRKDNI